MPRERGAVVADGDADLLDADRPEQPERPFEQTGAPDRGQAVRNVVVANRVPLPAARMSARVIMRER